MASSIIKFLLLTSFYFCCSAANAASISFDKIVNQANSEISEARDNTFANQDKPSQGRFVQLSNSDHLFGDDRGQEFKPKNQSADDSSDRPVIQDLQEFFAE